MRKLPAGWDHPIGSIDGGRRALGRVYEDPVTLLTAGATIIGSSLKADAQEDAGNAAAAAQTGASQADIAERRRQFDQIQALLSPYVQGGNKGLAGQLDLLGLNGNGAQQQAIQGIQNGPQFAALQQQGERSILANASATGGLRGGNTQAALAQFSPQLLNQLLVQVDAQHLDEQRFGQYGEHAMAAGAR